MELLRRRSKGVLELLWRRYGVVLELYSPMRNPPLLDLGVCLKLILTSNEARVRKPFKAACIQKPHLAGDQHTLGFLWSLGFFLEPGPLR